jgi:hypothetical protein
MILLPVGWLQSQLQQHVKQQQKHLQHFEVATGFLDALQMAAADHDVDRWHGHEDDQRVSVFFLLEWVLECMCLGLGCCAALIARFDALCRSNWARQLGH